MVEETSSLRDQLRTFRVIHFAIVMGSVTYGLVIAMIYFYQPMAPAMKDIQLLNTLEYVSVPYVIVIAAFVTMLRTKMLNSNSIFKKNETANTKYKGPPFMQNYLTQLFILWAIIETITIGGVILYFMSAKLTIPLVIISIGVFFKIMHGPRLEEVNKLSAKYETISAEGV